ncbi:cystatin C (amyloid angiopathy and cerebral hemorrhage) [Thalassophryne amazonica]|uniref:cystatin C (amyloid angiopathy and cerebral hemorrhage) n=1 Tax=Thalassophryne amazonica TaxID=390379 RepID=UPI0014725125|nr:cystatin C (amyloid angiopathy and cerebral hemorrhage) [Thalassophryne amazonica]
MIGKIFLLLFVAVCAKQHSMPGGVTDMTIADFKNSQAAQSALNYAVAAYNKRSNSLFHFAVLNVVSVQKQVVAGIRYIITVDMARTTCRKSNTELTCLNQSVSGNPAVERCKFDLWSRPWLNSIILQDENCTRSWDNMETA